MPQQWYRNRLKEIIHVDRMQMDYLLIQVHVQFIIGVFLVYFIQHIIAILVYIFQQVLVDVFYHKMLNVSEYILGSLNDDRLKSLKHRITNLIGVLRLKSKIVCLLIVKL
jgi:hypothetical protein